MGTFNYPMQISSLDNSSPRDIEAMVDTGAAYTMLPASLLRELGIEPVSRAVFELADKRTIEMDVGRAWVTINGNSEVTLVIFGEDDSPALLGSYTLTGLLLAVDPVAQKLIPTNAMLCQTGSSP